MLRVDDLTGVLLDAGEVDDLVVVDAAHHDGIDLDGREACLTGGLDPAEHRLGAVGEPHVVEDDVALGLCGPPRGRRHRGARHDLPVPRGGGVRRALPG